MSEFETYEETLLSVRNALNPDTDETMSTDEMARRLREMADSIERMRFSVCYNAAGCLPDSETYPYVVEIDSADDLAQTIEEELLYGAPDTEGQRFDPDELAAQAIRDGYLAVPMRGTYSLQVERTQELPDSR